MNKIIQATLKHIDKIKNKISEIINLSENDWGIMSNYIELKNLKKNEYLLKEGQISSEIAFVNKGLLIYYKGLNNGDEITTDFAFEDEWVTDNYSRLKKIPSSLYIKAIEDTELLLIKHDDLSILYTRLPELERFGRILTEQAFLKMTQLSIDLQILSAKERYIKLLKNRPKIFQRIPQYHIANYLGIAPKSLSRIRNAIFDKD